MESGKIIKTRAEFLDNAIEAFLDGLVSKDSAERESQRLFLRSHYLQQFANSEENGTPPESDANACISEVITRSREECYPTSTAFQAAAKHHLTKLWRRRWTGSGADRGFSIVQDTMQNSPTVLFLGPDFPGDILDKIIAAHNEVIGPYPGMA